MTPLTLAEIRDTLNDATPAMMDALLRDLDWMIRDGFDVRPAPAEGLPLHLRGVTPKRSFNLTNQEDFDWLADYFSGYHGVPGLRAAAAPAEDDACSVCVDDHHHPDTLCPICRYTQDHLAKPSAPAEGLDVERLARAVDRVLLQYVNRTFDQKAALACKADILAAIAREYAKEPTDD